MQGVVQELIAGSSGARDGLGEQRAGLSGLDDGAGQQVGHQALAQQDIVAGLPGALDGFLPEQQAPVSLSEVEASDGEHAQGFAEQPVVVQFAAELDGLPPEPCVAAMSTNGPMTAAVTSA